MTRTANEPFVATSMLLTAAEPLQPLTVKPAASEHVGNRIIGFDQHGRKVVVAQRPNGKGGVEFTKLMGGKVYAVAADGVSPVFEKQEDGKKSKIQKTEEGLPLFSCSGFYLLSSKEYPALEMSEAFTRLSSDGSSVMLISDEQMSAVQALDYDEPTEFDIELLSSVLESALGDENNLVGRFASKINAKREKLLRRAREDAEDQGRPFEGPAYAALPHSIKDGAPFVIVSAALPGGEVRTSYLLRQHSREEAGKTKTTYLTPAEAVARMWDSDFGKTLTKHMVEGHPVKVRVCAGHIMRTSPSFRKQFENAFSGASKPGYGSGVYIKGAREHWTRAIVVLLYSVHPQFPAVDYEELHFVAYPRQLEVSMQKADSGAWLPPQPIAHNIVAKMFE